MKKNLTIIIVALIGISTYLGYKMLDYKDTLVASTTYCETDSECSTLILDKDGCSAIPMSTYNMNYFELKYTDYGGCDALVTEQTVAFCKENSCVFTKN